MPAPPEVLGQPVTQDLDRDLCLIDLDRRVLEKAEVGAGAFDAIAERGATAAARDRVQVGHDLAAGTIVCGAQVQKRAAVPAGCRHMVGQRLSESTEDHGLQAQRRQRPHADRRRKLRIDHRPFG